MDAPLNSRVPATSSTYKGKEKAEPLDRLPIEIQEALILEDLLFVLMVCNSSSKYTSFDDFSAGHRGNVHHVSSRLLGGGSESIARGSLRSITFAR